MDKRKNKAAVALGKKRWAGKTKQEKREFSLKGIEARTKKKEIVS